MKVIINILLLETIISCNNPLALSDESDNTKNGAKQTISLNGGNFSVFITNNTS